MLDGLRGFTACLTYNPTRKRFCGRFLFFGHGAPREKVDMGIAPVSSSMILRYKTIDCESLWVEFRSDESDPARRLDSQGSERADFHLDAMYRVPAYDRGPQKVKNGGMTARTLHDGMHFNGRIRLRELRCS